jgi:lipopolysaccharide biosynthesis regulator YciM
MGVTSSEQVKRVQQILETLEQKHQNYQRAVSNLNRVKIQVQELLKEAEEGEEHASNSLEQTRKMLEIELVKMDPGIFIERREDAEREGTPAQR